jgi:hypothetical protein
MKKVPFPFQFLHYAFEATIPTEFYEVTDREFDKAMDEVNWNRIWFSDCCIYKDYNKTLGVYDSRIHKWYLNPDYFNNNLEPINVLCGSSSPGVCRDMDSAVADSGKDCLAE